MSDTPGKWIFRHRKQLKLRQEDVAVRAGVSVSYVSTLEREQKHTETQGEITPEREKAIAIAKAVQGDPDELLLLYGYAPTKATGIRPAETIEELLEGLEALGVPIMYTGIDKLLRDADGDVDLVKQWLAEDFARAVQRALRLNPTEPVHTVYTLPPIDELDEETRRVLEPYRDRPPAESDRQPGKVISHKRKAG